MDLDKIKTLIAFVGQSNVTELSVTEKGTTVRIFRDRDRRDGEHGLAAVEEPVEPLVQRAAGAGSIPVATPIFGILHRAPAPGELPFVSLGDEIVEGQTLFIIEAMKVFNTISAPRAGRVSYVADLDGQEVQAGDVLAEIAV